MRSLFRFFLVAVLLAAFLAAMAYWRGWQSRQSSTSAGPSGTLAAMDEEFVNLVASALPSVVSIDALPADAVDPRMRALRLLMGGQQGEVPAQLGAGAVVSEEGHIVTNYHVIAGAAAVRVYLSDGRIFQAQVLGVDPPSDIAILKIEAEGLQPLPIGDSDRVRIGQGVFAIGNPLGLQETVTQGIISGKGRRALSEAANEFFQTDAAINRGNSGGPLIDLQGSLIGITSMVSAGGEGIAFAIPSNTVQRVFQSIRDHGRFIRPWFGAMVRPLSTQVARQLGLADTRGALILGTYEDSPAARAGLQPGDVITSYAGKPIVDHIDLRNRVVETPIGNTIDLTILRKGKTITSRATVTGEPDR
ncbi:MAG: hypothetical protein Fur0032_21040 [Terrimicrobiaceae bacterium]